jgi:hypothetical protein
MVKVMFGMAFATVFPVASMTVARTKATSFPSRSTCCPVPVIGDGASSESTIFTATPLVKTVWLPLLVLVASYPTAVTFPGVNTAFQLALQPNIRAGGIEEECKKRVTNRDAIKQGAAELLPQH